MNRGVNRCNRRNSMTRQTSSPWLVRLKLWTKSLPDWRRHRRGLICGQSAQMGCSCLLAQQVLVRPRWPKPSAVGCSFERTTRINKHRECVLLLDEVEKVHPIVWNTFLQVFNAGRLTDSLGETIDFSQVVVIMTSNLGAGAYSKRTIGFGSPTGSTTP